MPEQVSPEPHAGASARDRVRAALVDALARRASAHAGAAREAIEARVAAVLQDAAGEAAHDGQGAVAPPPARGALAALVADVARRKPQPVLGAGDKPRGTPPAVPAAAKPGPAPAAAPADRTLQFFKRTWSRLSAGQRLAQSRATLPDNAGPLNSHHLVHRALTLMQSLSPEYLEHFVGYVDALQWLEHANEAAAAEPRAGAPRRSAALRR